MNSISYNHERPNYLLIAIIVIVACLSVYVCLLKNPKLLVQTPLLEGLNQYEKKEDLVTKYKSPPSTIIKTESKNITNSLKQGHLSNSHNYLLNKNLPVNFPFPDIWNIKGDDNFNYEVNHGHLFTSSSEVNLLIVTNLDSMNSWRLTEKPENTSPTRYTAGTNSLYWLSDKNTINLFNLQTNELAWSRLLNFSSLQLMATDKNQNLLLIQKSKNKTFFNRVQFKDGKVDMSIDLKTSETLLKIQSTENHYFIYGEESFYKINKKTQKIDWNIASFAPITNNILITQRTIYLATTAGQIVSIKVKNGEKNWEYNAEQPFEGQITLIPKFDRVAAMSNDGYIHTLDAVTGETRWRLKLKASAKNFDLTSLKLNSTTIMKFNLPWKYQAWTLWAPCSSQSLCILNPDNGQSLARYTNKAPIAFAPYFQKDRFVLLGQTDEKLSGASLNFYKLQK